ncbi:MAG: Fe-S cluster assembly ATPase SufC [Bacilli bacterium]|nr:Fe-S cluster assembly ATPase SufC [Bacilli bacterium]
MLSIKKLFVKVKDKNILNDFNLDIKEGEIHAIMGPNGTGKSTLSKVILGNKNYEVVSGDIIFKKESILGLKTDEIARKGIFVAFQNPISIEGVQNSEFLKTAINERRENAIGLFEFVKEIKEKVKELDFSEEMIHRAVNVGASGGERKKNEVLQLSLLEPEFIILDELDSGLDIDSLKKVCEAINKYLESHKKTSVLIITHYPRILEYIKPQFVHMMVCGKIVKTGDYNLAFEIEKSGYSDTSVMGSEKENE